MFREPVEIHHSHIALRESFPEEVDAGTEVAIDVRVSCPSGCDLTGTLVRVVAGDETLAAAAVVEDGEGTYGVRDLAITAPRDVGRHTLSIIAAGREADRVDHEEARLSVALTTLAHRSSLAAWGIPSPVVIGRAFEVTVGATCSAGCDLGGEGITVRDEDGIVVATATLGESPLPGTSALYWAAIDMNPPEREGPASWSVSFAPSESELPHEHAASTFSAAVVAPPEHTVVVRVTDGLTGTALPGARVLVGVHRGITDASGIATVGVPSGEFTLVTRKAGYDDARRSVQVTGDLGVEVELEPEPERDEFEDWM